MPPSSNRSRRLIIIGVIAIAVVVVGVLGYVYLLPKGTPTTTLNGSITGAGSTLVFPIMSSWTFAYHQVQPGVQVNYNSIGSSGGIAQITALTVNFGATDAPLKASQYQALPGTVVTIPESISAVVPGYNVPGISNGLKFTGDVLARIFLGNITTWNDAALVNLNPGVTLPNQAINVIHRSDGSGTMFAFTNYLSDSNAQWRNDPKLGTSTLPTWPVGTGCKGNEGVAGCIITTQYSLGPIEIAYAIQNPTLISVGSVRNAAGNFMNANQTTVSATVQAGAASGLPAGNGTWTGISIINNIYNNTAAVNAYPITTFTYIVAYQQQTNLVAGQILTNFLWWVVNSGQQAGVSLGYVPLPANVVTLDDATIKSMTYNGAQLYTGS